MSECKLTATKGHTTHVLVLLGHYLPGERSGGPARSIANVVAALGHECTFRILTIDRDLGSTHRYEGIRIREWMKVGLAEVMYLPERAFSATGVRTILTDTAYDVLYLNSAFSFRFSILPMLLRKLRLVPRRPLIIAPRGEFSPGALALKHFKKSLFLVLANACGLYRQSALTWQASTTDEERDIRRAIAFPLLRTIARMRVVSNVVGGARIATAMDVSAPCARERLPRAVAKVPGELNAVFVSRIAAKKNLHGLLNSLKQVSGAVRLAVYGPLEDAGYWRKCQKIIGELPANIQVTYRGVLEHSQVAPTLATYQLFAFPTFGENFGHVIAEALIAGCPVLTTDATPWQEIEIAGAGTIVCARDASIAEAIQDYIDADEVQMRRMSEAARALGERRAANVETIDQNRALFTTAAAEVVG